MPINAELQKWIAEKVAVGLSPEQQQQLNSIFGVEAVAEQINRAWMAPPDYNRKMNELKEKEQQIVDRANAELQQHVNTLKTWQETEAQKNVRLQQEVERLQKLAQDEGLVVPQSVAQPTAQSNGNSHQKYLSQEDALRLVQSELAKAALLPGLTHQIAERHRELFGKAPDIAKITDVAMRTGRSLVDTWRAEYKVEDKEREIAEAAIQKRIDDGISAGIAKLQSDGAMSAQNFSGGRQAPPSVIRQMMQNAAAASGNSPLVTPAPVMQRSDAVAAAEAAFASGKFEVKQPGQ